MLYINLKPVLVIWKKEKKSVYPKPTRVTALDQNH